MSLLASVNPQFHRQEPSIRERLHELKKGPFSAPKLCTLLHAGEKFELKKDSISAHVDEQIATDRKNHLLVRGSRFLHRQVQLLQTSTLSKAALEGRVPGALKISSDFRSLPLNIEKLCNTSSNLFSYC